MKNGKIRVGKIADISLGGLALNYMENAAIEQDRGHVDLFTAGKNFYMPDVPVRVVYDLQPQSEEGEYSSVAMNRCGIAFGRLTENQTSQLTAFLDDYATSGVPSNPGSTE